MTWQEAIHKGILLFEQTGIADARTNAEYLAAHILGLWNKSELRNYANIILTQEQISLYEKLIFRRKRHEPLQHITGETEFFGLRFLTSLAALIPRPDTEILVEEALKEASQLARNDLKILDIGTGSGIIALSLASKFPDAHVIGIDISQDASSLAQRNQERLKISNAVFEVLDIFEGTVPTKFSSSIDILISNPPYISAEEFETLGIEVRNFDPRIALTDESDGLSFYRRIAELAPKLLKDSGKIIVEIGYGGAEKVEKIFTTAGLNVNRIVKDLQGIERVMVICI